MVILVQLKSQCCKINEDLLKPDVVSTEGIWKILLLGLPLALLFIEVGIDVIDGLKSVRYLFHLQLVGKSLEHQLKDGLWTEPLSQRNKFTRLDQIEVNRVIEHTQQKINLLGD